MVRLAESELQPEALSGETKERKRDSALSSEQCDLEPLQLLFGR